jgi:hypothetical protein
MPKNLNSKIVQITQNLISCIQASSFVLNKGDANGWTLGARQKKVEGQATFCPAAAGQQVRRSPPLCDSISFLI